MLELSLTLNNYPSIREYTGICVSQETHIYNDTEVLYDVNICESSTAYSMTL